MKRYTSKEKFLFKAIIFIADELLQESCNAEESYKILMLIVLVTQNRAMTVITAIGKLLKVLIK